MQLAHGEIGLLWDTRWPYFVERWTDDDQHVDLLAAMCSNVAFANAAFDAAVKAEPNKIWYIRQRTNVIRRHPVSAT